MIEVKKLTKSYRDNVVLSDITFSIPKSQVVAIVGKSGVGKSVLLKCLIGILLVMKPIKKELSNWGKTLKEYLM